MKAHSNISFLTTELQPSFFFEINIIPTFFTLYPLHPQRLPPIGIIELPSSLPNILETRSRHGPFTWAWDNFFFLFYYAVTSKIIPYPPMKQIWPMLQQEYTIYKKILTKLFFFLFPFFFLVGPESIWPLSHIVFMQM